MGDFGDNMDMGKGGKRGDKQTILNLKVFLNVSRSSIIFPFLLDL